MNKVTGTERGFPRIDFTDRNGNDCSLQCSSAIDFDVPRHETPGSSFVWLGVNDANPQIMATDAQRAGITTSRTTGWVNYPIPSEVIMSTRMHLSREQVKHLIGHLQTWLASGNL